MATPQKNNGMHWLLMVLVIAGVVVVLAKVLRNPSTDGTNEEIMPPEDSRQNESKPPPNDLEPPISRSSAKDSRLEPPAEREYNSENPLYFRVVFGQESTDSALGVLDESEGTGTGYNLAYVDENRNGDLTDDAPKTFPKYDRGSRSGQTNPTFNFSGPFKSGASADYALNIYSLARKNQPPPDDYSFFWTLDTDGWNYFFINGKMRLSSSAADALTGPPVRLAGHCKWNISASRRSGKSMVSAGLKDGNGCTLRIVTRPGGKPSPRLSLIKNGKIELEKDMEFG